MKRLSFFVRLVVSLALIAWFAASMDLNRVVQPITPSGWIYIVFVFLLVNLDRLLMSYKWNILLRAKGLELPFSEVVRSYYIATFWGALLPSTVGGDAVRVFQVSKQIGSTKDVFSSIVLERVLGLAATLLVGMLSVGLFVILVDVGYWKIMVGLLCVSVALSCVVLILFSTRVTKWLDQQSRLHRNGLSRRLADLLHSYQEYRQHRSSMLRFFSWSVLEQFIPALVVFLVSRSLNLAVPLWSFFILVPVIVALSRIPLSLDGFGIREGLYVYFFSFVGLPRTDAFFLGLLSHILGTLFVLPGFFCCSFLDPMSKLRLGFFHPINRRG